MRSSTICFLAWMSGCASPVTAEGLPVFPGAVGFGVGTPAGRGGRILHVTTLRESGPGSLRACLDTDAPRTCVFDVSGTITTHDRVRVRHPYLTLAGQTAPSPGITIRGAGLYVETHDVLVQHLRIRVGDDRRGPPPDTRDGLAVLSKDAEAYRVVLDHVSVSWATDENVEFWYGARDSTISNSIISEGLFKSLHSKGHHSRGLIIGKGSTNISVIGTLFANNDRRNPRVAGRTRVFFANNLVYGWSGAAGEWGTDEGALDATIVGNVFVRSPETPAGSKPFTLSKSLPPGGRVFLDDNLYERLPADPWSLVWLRTKYPIKANAPSVWPSGFVARPALGVQASVLANSGARPLDRDRVDTRVVDGVRKKTGRIIDSQNDVGGWPVLAERRETFVVPPDPHGDSDGDGYTNLEERLHELARALTR